MNLPFILDVIIGLFFVYLILSLLASEIQELITTLLQWRAKHLRDSIENLIAGGTESAEQKKVKALVQSIYDDPLIRDLNQGARGLWAQGFRKITQWIFPSNRKGAFGLNQTSGPSYIASDTFATALLERLGISTFVDKLIDVRLDEFIKRIIGEISISDSTITLADPPVLVGIWEIADASGIDLTTSRSFRSLVEDFYNVQQDYRKGCTTILFSIDRLSEALDRFVASYPDPRSEDLCYFCDRVTAFKLNLFGTNNERAILSGGLQPTLADVVALANKGSAVYKQVAGRFTAAQTRALAINERVMYQTEALLQERSGLDIESMAEHQPTEEERNICREQALRDLDEEEYQIYQDYQVYQRVEQALDHLPSSVQQSLAVLARRAQNRVQSTQNSVEHFREEVALWFDDSMSRASGVYKRNAKGVAIIVGIAIAMFTNSDTFHIFNRIASDESLRKVITDRASQIAPSQDSRPDAVRQDLERLKDETEGVLADIALPITWNPSNLSRQLGCPYAPSTTDLRPGEDKIYSLLTRDQWNDLYKACLGIDTVPENTSIPLQVVQMIGAKPLGFFRMVSGWLVSGIAISMGAPFWFDLLGKVVNVRNTGSKPKSTEKA